MDLSRTVYIINFSICLLLIGVAFFFNHALQVNPCPLCSLQLSCYYVICIISLTGFFHDPERMGRYAYAILLLVMTILGIIFALRQVWLQHLPMAHLRVCEPHLSSLISQLGFYDLVRELFYYGDECTPVQWKFLSVTMAGWSVFFFALLIINSLVLLFHAIRNK